MTTNSPNPVDGDVQALIDEVHYNLQYCFCSEKTKKLMQIALSALTAEPVAWVVMAPHGDYIESNPDCVANIEGSGDAKCKPLYTTPPAQLLRPVELPDDAPNALLALCQQVYDSRITGASVAQDVWQDCLDELRQQGIEVKS
ncbi:hypothetical protein [Pantoea stewartii]|uniref:hypothetical protein n=1 Tax=Pantoea stewartii TaxID=66269 RepID=UPI0016269EAD|nr:hypothetical protein [Pantoea stewartii]MBC0853837.1 hypothetical protein [Pantoea stewartii]